MTHKYNTQVQGQLLVSQKKILWFYGMDIEGTGGSLTVPKYKCYRKAAAKID